MQKMARSTPSVISRKFRELSATRWVRFERSGAAGFGMLRGDAICVHTGDMFSQPEATSETVMLSEVKLLTPCQPSKMIGLWNNFAERAKAEGLVKGPHPSYFLKANNSFHPHNAPIRRPQGDALRVIYEGKLCTVD